LRLAALECFFASFKQSKDVFGSLIKRAYDRWRGFGWLFHMHDDNRFRVSEYRNVGIMGDEDKLSLLFEP
jgi:hypothetical protein